jgi:protein TonB
MAPRVLKKPDPVMTEGARANRVRGDVGLSLEVWPDGRAHRIVVVQPLPYGLHWEAIRAVRKWRFQPGTKNGKPVKIRAFIEVNFSFR